MNKLSPAKHAAILKALVEGTSFRATARLTGTSKATVLKRLVEVGEFCGIFQDHMLRGLPCVRIEADEIWAFVGAKRKNATTASQGDIWTFTCICSDTKLMVSWLVGPRDGESAGIFMQDVAARLVNRVQLTTDGHDMYLQAVEDAFGWRGCDYARLVKKYAHSGNVGYSPPECVGTEKERVMGNPDPAKISTSYVERQNLTMRMNLRRFTRLTNAFSRKAENHAYAVALHFFHYNFCRPHQTLTVKRDGIKTTPAMAAGVTNRIWKIEELVTLTDPRAVTLK